MKEAIYDTLVSEIEANRFKWDHEYSLGFEAIIKDHEQELTEQQLQHLRMDAIAFRFMTRDTTKDKKGERIQPSVVYTDGSTFPDIAKDLSDETFDYYQKRLGECANPTMRLRYADILWEKDKRIKSKLTLARQLVDAALEASNVFDHDNELERVDCLNRALQVSLAIGKAGEELAKTVAAAVTARLKKLRDENHIRFTLELIETIINFNKQFTKDDFNLCKEICEVAIKHYRDENNNFMLRGAFVQRSYELDKLLDPTSYDQKAAARAFAQTRIEEAEKRTDSLLVQQSFLREAHKILQDAGLSSEAAELLKRIEALGKDEHFDNQFKPFSITHEIPSEVIDALEDLLKKQSDTAALIAISPNFISKWSEAENTAKKDTNNYMSDMFSSVRYDDNGMAIAVSGGDAAFNKTMRYFQTNIEFKLTYLSSLLRKLINESAIAASNFSTQFDKLRYIDEATHTSILCGLKLYLEGSEDNLYAASLILTTQLEDLMFRLLPKMEVTQYIAEKDGQTHSPKTIGWFLKEMKEAVGDDIYRLCDYTLIDKANLNIRNRVSHGKTKITDDNEMICVRILQIISVFCVMLNVNEAEGAE